VLCVEVLTLVFDMLSMEIDAKLSVILTLQLFTSRCCFMFCMLFSFRSLHSSVTSCSSLRPMCQWT